MSLCMLTIMLTAFGTILTKISGTLYVDPLVGRPVAAIFCAFWDVLCAAACCLLTLCTKTEREGPECAQLK